jgi:hypothetical protein
MRIYLAPPKNPNSAKAEDRRWHIIVSDGRIAQYTQVYGPSSIDTKGAKAEANRLLKHNFTWLKRGTGFQARMPKESK